MCVAVVAAATAMLPVLSALSTGASVGDAWTSASGALPATDGAGDGPATDDQSALVGQTACPTDNDCFAVGGYLDSAGNTAGDIESISQSAPGASTVTHIVAPEPATDPAGNGPQDSGSAHLFAQLYSVSCASPSSCVAVGTYQDSAGEDWALVESWQGASTWTASVAPEPAGNSAGFGPGTGAREVATLWDVDCYAVGSCVAVGSYGDADGRVWPMIDTLSGGVWTATTVEVAGQGPGQDGVSSWLQAVSCTVDGFCVAGGAWNDAQESASVGIVATGSDGAWTSASPAPPTGVTALAQVTAVACAPSGPCVGLGPGNLGPGTGYGSSLIAYTYSQATQEWSTSVVPLPAGNAAGTPGSWFNDYDSISCPAAGDCVGTANANDTGGWASEATLITQTPSGWTSGLAPSPAGDDPAGFPAAATGFSLRSVACPAAGSCVAVGYYPDTSGGDWGLVETLSGGSWTASTMPDPPGSGTDGEYDQYVGLFSVGCTSDGSCGAAGSDEDPSANSRLFAADEVS